MSGELTICPTPIGNLGDMPPRALEALRSADVVCAEDTRVTGKLLSAFGVRQRLERLDENLMSGHAGAIVERVRAGERIAYCSDAGMPGVSDPGQRLVDAALEAGVPVEVIPGPTAVATAYVASGFTCPRFYFAGFFPRKDGARREALEMARMLDAVTIFYESPHRIAAALELLAGLLPDRRVAVCRELTKLHEEVCRDTASELALRFAEREREGGVKGEIVLVIDAPGQKERDREEEGALISAADRAAQLVQEGELSGKDIVKTLREEFGLSRNEAYKLVHAS